MKIPNIEFHENPSDAIRDFLCGKKRGLLHLFLPPDLQKPFRIQLIPHEEHPSVCITKTKRLMWFMEIIATYFKNTTKHRNTVEEMQNFVKLFGLADKYGL